MFQYIILMLFVLGNLVHNEQQEDNISKLLNSLYDAKLITVSNLEPSHPFYQEMHQIPNEFFKLLELIQTSKNISVTRQNQPRLKSGYEKGFLMFRLSHFRENNLSLQCLDIALTSDGTKGKLIVYQDDFANQPKFYYRWRHSGEVTEYLYRVFSKNGEITTSQLRLNFDGSGSFKKSISQIPEILIKWRTSGEIIK